MWRYIFWKTVSSFIALIIMTIILYLLYVSVNDNPFESLKTSFTGDSGLISYEKMLDANGINDPAIVRFFSWFGDVLQGDWGDVYTVAPDKTVPEVFFDPLEKSMMVALPAYAFGTMIGLTLGFISGYQRGKFTDTFINAFVTIFIAIPAFVFAAFALLLAPELGLPAIFEESVGTEYMIQSLIMPILVMTLFSLARWTFLLRNEVSQILTSDYVLAARTKGYSELFIFRRYVLRNALYPFAGALASSFVILFGSSIIVENFFNVPGTSLILVDSIRLGEINIVMFNLVFFGFIGMAANIVADVAQFSINPLVKAQFSSKRSPFAKLKLKVVRDTVAAQGGMDD